MNYKISTIVTGIIGILALIVIMGSYEIIQPGYRGILVTLGSVNKTFYPEGLNFKIPLISTMYHIPIRQRTAEIKAECFSSDLQQVDIKVKVLYRIPQQSVVKLFMEFQGDPMDNLIAPRVQEALKEVTAAESAEHIVKRREEIKTKALDFSRKKVGEILYLEDLVLENIELTKELEQAIEAKMVQEQEASKAKFIKQKAQIEAETMLLKAEAEAKSIHVRGEAIRENKGVVELQIVEKWDGKAPLVVGNGQGTSIILPMAK